MIVPVTLARRATDNRNPFNQLAESVFEPSMGGLVLFYQDALCTMMLGKCVQIHRIMESASIEGSARLVIVPSSALEYDQVCNCCERGNELRGATATLRNGEVRCPMYGDTPIKFRDWVLMVCPPLLCHASLQTLRVKPLGAPVHRIVSRQIL